MGLPLNHRLQLGHLDARRAARRRAEREARQREETRDESGALGATGAGNGGTSAAGLETTKVKGRTTMHANEQDVARVAKIIMEWQRRHPRAMDTTPEWAAQNLAIDLAQAGEIYPGLPVPFGEPVDPLDPVLWEVPVAAGSVEASHDGRVRLPWGTTLTADEADEWWRAIAAAALRARANDARYRGDDGVI